MIPTSPSYGFMQRLREKGVSPLSRFQIWRTRQTLPPAGLVLSPPRTPRRILREEEQAKSLTPLVQIYPTKPIPPEVKTRNKSPTDPLSKNASAPHPFLPFFHPVSKRWRPARISARREADLVNEAYRTGQLDLIPDESKKKQRLLARLERSSRGIGIWTEDWRPTTTTTTNTTEATSSTSSNDPSDSTKTPLKSPPGKKHLFSKEEIASHQRAIFKQLAEAGYGPISGRNPKIKGMKRFFKGTLAQRTRKSKDRNIQQKMDEMDEEVEQWRLAKKAAARKFIPAQPF